MQKPNTDGLDQNGRDSQHLDDSDYLYMSDFQQGLSRKYD